MERVSESKLTELEAALAKVIGGIQPIDAEAVEAAKRRLDQLTKPPGSLGRLEELAWQIAGMTGRLDPDLSRKAVVVMAGDHGVCEEGVSAFPQEVTPQMVLNFLHGGAAVNVLARHAGAEVVCVDVGVKADIAHPQLVSRKVRYGTANIAVGPAMSRAEAAQAVLVGVETVRDLGERGFRLFATGEMGIGNTTPSSALLAALTGANVEAVVGRGTGIDEARRQHKAAVVRRALEANREAVAAGAGDPLGVLAALGGLEIAGLVGVIIGAAAQHCPVVIDGFISSAAALVASRLAPEAASYMLPSHLSQEQGHRQLLEGIGMKPMLEMGMRLGEGTGAVLGLPIVEAAVKIMNEMATFESAGISKG
ncbi:nicotinate-nucleotide--dimethylbenzimidazole phosphoribosyltransferase [Paenibacillus koleovorans]|uniref:nicotinate-nucleotide--dimethylbenzimidazole phosphoribosyltransferase n=1 Tax=Paenibacillus koleovorans TaxID=121608 RepID=UPI000FD8D6CD|nr:nicotinate-nucleotide--dimethylbenzimidazole phosphoribosyltransferase [Paenibacillus koleovorans]